MAVLLPFMLSVYCFGETVNAGNEMQLAMGLSFPFIG